MYLPSHRFPAGGRLEGKEGRGKRSLTTLKFPMIIVNETESMLVVKQAMALAG